MTADRKLLPGKVIHCLDCRQGCHKAAECEASGVKHLIFFASQRVHFPSINATKQQDVQHRCADALLLSVVCCIATSFDPISSTLLKMEPTGDLVNEILSVIVNLMERFVVFSLLDLTEIEF